MVVVALFLVILFAGLSLLHIYWALGGRFGVSVAIPEVEGRPLFSPGVIGTLVVALLLAGIALVALVLGFGVGAMSVISPYTVYLGYAVGMVLVLRAIGEFRYVGFFKRVKGSRFAAYDSWLFSPCCLLAGGAFMVLAASGT